jgi:5-methylcytosine-specific restriction endonuclease McrA
VLCLQQGRTVVASIRDHIIALADGGTEDEANTQAICRSCNEVKRWREATEGKYKRGSILG